MSVKNIYASNETSQKFSLKSIWLFLETTLNWMTLKYGCKAETWCYHKIWKKALFFTKKKHTYKFQIPLTFFALCYSYKGSALYYCLYSLCRQARDFARSLSKEGKGHRCCGHERCCMGRRATAHAAAAARRAVTTTPPTSYISFHQFLLYSNPASRPCLPCIVIVRHLPNPYTSRHAKRKFTS